jgi:hypothetical protein
VTTKTDTYNYTQNPLSGNYTTITAAGLKSASTGANGSSSGTQDNVTSWATSNYTFANDQSSEFTFGSTPTNNDWAGAAVRLSTTGSGQGYIAYYIPEVTEVAIFPLTSGTVGSGTTNAIGGVTGITFASGDKLKLSITGTTLTVYKNGTLQTTTPSTVTSSTYSSGQPGLAYQFGNSDGTKISGASFVDASGGAATLSSPTPSGTLGTQTTATLGATSTSSSGTIYGVIDTAGNISGITAAQVVAGQNNTGSAAAFSNSNTVTTTSASIAFSGLTAGTTYSYALVQNNGSNSNVVTGTFTTALASPVLSAPTPSGTLGSQTSVTLGCTSTSNSGTVYGVIDTAANLSGVTAAQVVAGQNKNSSAAAFSANAAVSNTSPMVGISGLTAGTLYSYAIAQNNGTNSNVVTGTFTTLSPQSAIPIGGPPRTQMHWR